MVARNPNHEPTPKRQADAVKDALPGGRWELCRYCSMRPCSNYCNRNTPKATVEQRAYIARLHDSHDAQGHVVRKAHDPRIGGNGKRNTESS